MIRMMIGVSVDGELGEHPYDGICGMTPACRDVNPNQNEEELVVSPDRPNHFAHDSLGDPDACTEDHNHPQRGFITKDSGQRLDYASGMRRDVQEWKPRFDLIFPEGVPFEAQLLTRYAALLERGAVKYGENNWQLANSDEELKRFRASGLRHMVQWACGEEDEDHAAAVIFNLMAYEETKRKMEATGDA